MIYFLLITIQLTRLNGDGLFDDVTPLHLPHLAHLSWRMKQYFFFFFGFVKQRNDESAGSDRSGTRTPQPRINC